MNKDTGGPAFPCPDHDGLTLRDYFAAKAMQAWVSRGDDSGENGIAKWAYEMADAMLKARLKAQRDALLEALRDLMARLDPYDYPDEQNFARAAIKAVEENT